ncbi:MAG: DUF3352 domain-containing protein [Patescibacteria group bacterium]|nr:DUF3352 domain-containing protein [Patescibacteria group bacterium]
MKNPFIRLGIFIIIVAALLSLGFIGKLTYEKIVFNATPADILPVSDIAFYAEIDLRNGQADDWNDLFSKYPYLQSQGLENQLALFLGWQKLSEIDLTQVAFAFTNNREPALAIADFPNDALSQMEKDLKGAWNDDIVSAKNRALSWTARGDFIWFARNSETLRRILDSDGEKLSSSENFIKIRDGLPKGAAFVYFDGARLNNQADKNSNVLNQTISEEELWQPIAQLIQQGGASLSINDNGLLINTKTVYDEGLSETASRIFSRVKASRHDLSRFFPAQTIAFYESTDLQADWRDLNNILRTSAPVLNELWQRRQVYWEQGTGLSLTDDILKLADGPYAIGVEQDSKTGSGTFEIMAVFQNDGTFLREKMDYLKTLLLKKIPAMYPEMIETQLPDGKTAEVLQIGKAAKGEVTKVGNLDITVLDFPELPFDLAYTVSDEYLLLATSKQALINMIDVVNSGKNTLSQADDFKDGLDQIEGMKTDLTFLDLGKIDKWLPKNWREIIKPFASIAGGKNLLDFESLTAWWIKIAD